MTSSAAQALLVVQRKRLVWMDTLRAYRVLIDGDQVGRLRDGETGEYAVSPGHHVVQVRIDWTGSEAREVRVLAGQRVSVVVQWRGNLFSRRGYLGLRIINSKAALPDD